MPGTLYLVATPIGNLEDISARALRILGSVAVVAAEDTRRSKKLLAHYGISTPLVSFHAHSPHGELKKLLDRLARGSDVALVSDAGMPCISDPGTELVAAARRAGIPVDVIPGPSALTTVLAIAGIRSERSIFIGFAPKSQIERRTAFSELARWDGSVVMFESPERINSCISDIYKYFGNRHIVVGRELTKLHQEVTEGLAEDIIDRPLHNVGEFALVVGPPDASARVAGPPGAQQIADEFGELTEHAGFRRRDAVVELARQHGVSTREMYKLVNEALKSGE
jgi:16S rRNA (cytidine1402-2'-O)-methyltransferase